ncbi:hypothetical protein D3P09_16735 [Paenibacillus pinisoli]|uniref:Uncharacterized protein n=1 Tax=Paenibacillus pinisoli TaxID=1276110 RepID=A0A3A6PJ03_9BACL|nr:hypothetical protein [Paenibacillus pinisoli]RJX39138.1 hypothetical protein D3P09_16735 [Paenibacillus pinisoli]
MKTTEVTAQRFADKFGPEHVAPGPFAYYECDNGLGIIKDTVKNTIQLVKHSQFIEQDLSPEDEFAMLTAVSGPFVPDTIHPPYETLADFEFRERKAATALSATWSILILVFLTCLVLAILLAVNLLS